MKVIKPSDATTVPPRVPRRGRGLLFWIKRGVLMLVGALIALAVTGAIYRAIATEVGEKPGPQYDFHLLPGRCRHFSVRSEREDPCAGHLRCAPDGEKEVLARLFAKGGHEG
jgi:hypothetical protein